MTPYSGRYLPNEYNHFNKRLSRARRTSENSFGIMVARWRIFHRTIIAEPETADSIVKAVVVLHNVLCESSRDTYAPRTFVDTYYGDVLVEGRWRRELEEVNSIFTTPRAVGEERIEQNAINIRNIVKDYINNTLV